MESGDKKMHYSVVITSTECPCKPDCMPQCTDNPCCYLCRHMVTCTCYDYQHGHLCKHCHRIYCLHNQQSLTVQDRDLDSTESENVDSEQFDVQEAEDIVQQNATNTTQTIGITPSKSLRLETGM